MFVNVCVPLLFRYYLPFPATLSNELTAATTIKKKICLATKDFDPSKFVSIAFTKAVSREEHCVCVCMQAGRRGSISTLESPQWDVC